MAHNGAGGCYTARTLKIG
ncbi:IS1-like element transposase, partial [Shigella sp. FC1180]